MQGDSFGAGQRIFRRYTLQKIIGRGGMGVVWLAHDAHLETPVALKVLPDMLAHDSASLDSLKRETKLGLCLAHPHIVRIYDFQNDENAAAISMEYVDGGNLSDLRVKRPTKIFNPNDLSDWLEALFDGLEYAHVRQQIVHRDLKPRNLMLNSRGELKIADFGISRSISDSMTMLTGMLTSTGSPPYVSPQQWDGERPTPLDDIYSIGATLYELLTSKPPLLGVVDWQQVHHKVAPPIGQRRLDLGIQGAEPIPAHWEETIAACLAKDPKDRPQTVSELWARLLPDSRHTTVLPPNGRTRNPLPLEIPGTAPAEDDNVTFERTIERGATLPGRPSKEAETYDETIFNEPTLRHPKESRPPANDIEAGVTIRREPEQEIPEEAAAGSRKRFPTAIWLTLIAIALLGSLVYLVFFQRTPPAVRETLTVQSNPPGATITLDSAKYATAPHTFEEVQSGTHWLTATLDGYLPAQQDLQVHDETSRKILINLEPEPLGTLSVTTSPSGAVVLLDEKPPDRPQNTFTKISFGRHRLKVSLEGYETVYEELNIETRKATHKVPELKRTQQWLRRQELVDQVKKYINTPESPEYIKACAKYLLHLDYTGSASAPELPPEELKRDLEKIIEQVRLHQAPLNPSIGRQEFQKYRDAISSAAKTNSLQAILMLAENETQQDEKFRLFYRAATEHGDPGAMMMLGVLYFRGKSDVSGNPDFEKALEWFQEASKAGNTEATAYYYDCYLYGDPKTKRSEEDQKAAVGKLKELAGEGVAHAAVVLGQWYKSKARVATDSASKLKLNREAAEWWRKAKGPREWRACYYLATLHEKGLLNEDGKPTRDDLATAKALYQEGAENEDIVCMFHLGRFILEHSDHSERAQRERALRLIRDAADADYEEAKKWLEQLERARQTGRSN